MENIFNKFSRLDQMLRNLNKLENHSELYTPDKIVLEHQLKQFSNSEVYEKSLEKLQSLNNIHAEYQTSLTDVKSNIISLLRNLEVAFMQYDYQRYELSLSESVNIEEIVKHRRAGDSLLEYIIGLNQANSDWKFSSIDLNPTDDNFTSTIVAGDPLYIYGESELLGYAKQKLSESHNEFYANRRVRYYSDLNDLPDNSFGLMHCFGRYEHLPLDPIKDEARILITKLAPGGSLFFSYNDCEQRSSLEMCNGYRAYQTYTQMHNMYYGLGYDIQDNRSFDGGTHTVMHVKRPGEMISQKINSPMLGIVRKELTPEQTEWIEAHRQTLLNQWISSVTNSPDYPGEFDVDKQRIIEYIQWNIDTVTE